MRRGWVAVVNAIQQPPQFLRAPLGYEHVIGAGKNALFVKLLALATHLLGKLAVEPGGGVTNAEESIFEGVSYLWHHSPRMLGLSTVGLPMGVALA